MRERGEIGGYRIVKRIGFGGMSTVFEAIDGGGNRVALKLLHPSIAADPLSRDRLRREVRTLRQVKSNYVAQVIDAETEGDEAFIVTELVDGPTLGSDVEDQGVYTGGDLADLARELAAALRSIHESGVLHRDLKPSNVMMGENGPVLIDFGIAQVAEESRLTATGFIAHTPGYCAPEVLNGDDPTTGADWWAWAAVLAYAASGRAPYGTGHSPKVMRKVLSGESDLRGIEPTAAYALRRALSPDATDRISPEHVIGILDGTIDVYPWEIADDGEGAGSTATSVLNHPGETSVAYGEATEASGETIVPGEDWDEFPPAQPPQVPPHVASARIPGEGTGRTRASLPDQSDVWEQARYEAQRQREWQQGSPPSWDPQHPAALQPAYGPRYAADGRMISPGPPVVQRALMDPAYARDVAESVYQRDTWFKPAPPRHGLLALFWAVLAAWTAVAPMIVATVYFFIHMVISILGVTWLALANRRALTGKRSQFDSLSVVGRLPFSMISGFVRTLAAVGIGLVVGALVLWLLQMTGLSPLTFNVGVAGALALLISWFYPTADPTRLATRRVLHTVAPPGGYTAFWVVLGIALGATALWFIATGTGVDWSPFSQPSFVG